MSELPVSVVIPTFNRVEFLAEAVSSIIKQTERPAEIIVVDDGSTQDIRAALAQFGETVTYLRKDNGGKSTALNCAMAKATQEYVWIFDDDDIAVPNALELLVDALEGHEGLDWAYGMCDRFDGFWTGETSGVYPQFYSENSNALRVKTLEDFFIWQGALLVRRSLYDRVGPFNIDLPRSQDYEMLLRISRRSVGVPIHQVLFHQRHHAGLRGPAKEQLTTRRAIERMWLECNQRIFSDVYKTYSLDEFLVDLAPGAPGAETTALIQRASIMARNGLWMLASRDMCEAGRGASERSESQLSDQALYALRRQFQPNSRSHFASREQADEYFQSLRSFPQPIQRTINRVLFFFVPYRLKSLVRSEDPSTEAKQVAILLGRLARPSVLRDYAKHRRSDAAIHDIAHVATI